MVRIQRANVVLDIENDDDLIQKYLDKGYNVLDEKGNVVKRAMPFEVGALQALVTEQEQKIKQLQEQLAKIEAKYPALEKPKRTRTKKTEE